ncbi:jg2456 [Pararge aegeria aegeria]|uniref:Jg2456 protein n=1 Tax=Pararge aegeria aegeria TaxID=348720 RepID=A0A8S4QJ86_9NEOP|nr:jg2456 [Pararge aegeria aegeria]
MVYGRTSVPEHDHPLGARSSNCYGREYHLSSRTRLACGLEIAGLFEPIAEKEWLYRNWSFVRASLVRRQSAPRAGEDGGWGG